MRGKRKTYKMKQQLRESYVHGYGYISISMREKSTCVIGILESLV